MSEIQNYQIGFDTTEVEAGGKRTEQVFADIGKEAEATGDKMSKMLAAATAGFMSFSAAKSFVSKVYEVRSAFQDAQSSMAVFLGSAEKGTKFFNELKDYAWYNMFEFTDLVEASTQLIAFGNATEDIIPIIDRLSNIASGTKKPLEEYVQLFNKAKSTGKVQAQDLQSWAAHGVVVVDVLKEMGVEADRSNIKFDDLQKVLAHLTDEGGQFAGLMESQMDNLSASFGQLQDDWANMLNEIGEKTQDLMKKGIEIGSALIENYETIGKVIAQAVVIYGAYKTALLTAIAIEKVKKGLTLVDEYISMAKALGTATANQIMFNTAAMMNPYVWIAVAVAGIAALAGTIAIWGNKSSEVTKEIGEQEQAIRNETDQINNLSHKLTEANTSEAERKKILAEINKINPEILKGLDYEAEGLQGVINRLKEYNEEQAKRAVVAGYSDKTNTAVQNVNEAKINSSKAKDDLEKSLNELYNAVNNGTLKKMEYSNGKGIFGIYKAVELTDEDKQTILASFDEVMNNATLSVEEKTAQMQKIMTDFSKQGSLSGNYSYLNLQTSNEAQRLYQQMNIASYNLTQAKKDEQAATKALTEAQNEEQAAIERAGLTIDQNTNQTEGGKVELSKYKDEVKATTKKIKELDDVIKQIQTNPNFDYSGYGENANKALEEARKQRSTQASAYKNLTGKDYDKTDYKKIADDIRKRREKMQQAIDDGEIAAMQDGMRKKLAQIENDKKKRIAAINQEERELQAALKKAGKKETAQDKADFNTQREQAEAEASRNQQKVEEENAKYIANLYRELGDVFASEEQRKIDEITRRYNEQRKQLKKDVEGGTIEQKDYDSLSTQIDKAQAKEIEDFWLQTYGNYYQKREQLTTQWEQKLAAIPEQYRTQAKIQMQQEISQLDIEKFKKDMDWSGIFGNLGEQAYSSLVTNLEKVQSYLDANKMNLGVDEIKDLQQAITQMEQEISNRNPFAGMHLAMQRISQTKDELVSALQEMETAEYELATAQREYNAAKEAEELLLQQMDAGEIATNQEAIAAALERTQKAQTALTTAEQKSTNAQKKVQQGRNSLTSSYKNFANQLSKCNSTIQNVGSNAKNLAAVFSQDVGNGIGKALDFIDEVLDATTNVISSLADVGINVTDKIEKTVDAAAQGMTATSAAGAQSISTMEKASVILTIISAALQVATAIANLFTSDEAREKRIEGLQRRISQLKWEMQNMDAVTFFEQIGDPIQHTTDLLHETYNAVYQLYDVYDILDGRVAEADEGMLQYAKDQMTKYGLIGQILGGHEGAMIALAAGAKKVSKELSNQIAQEKALKQTAEKLADEYAKLEYAAGKAIGVAQFDTVRKQLTNLGEQSAALAAQIEEEKKAKHPDEDKIQELEQSLKETTYEMATTFDDMIDEIFGGSYKEIAEQLGDAFFEAFQSGEDAAEAWGSKVQEIVGQIVKKMLIAEFLEQPIADIFSKYKNMWYDSEGNFLGIQNVIDTMSGLTDELNGVQDQFSQMYDAMPEDLKEFLTDSGREGTERGIATASQDSVDENNARLTVIQGHTYSLVEGIDELNRTGNLILENVMHIADNSDEITNRLENVESRVNRVSDTLNEIQLKGIKIKS